MDLQSDFLCVSSDDEETTFLDPRCIQDAGCDFASSLTHQSARLCVRGQPAHRRRRDRRHVQVQGLPDQGARPLQDHNAQAGRVYPPNGFHRIRHYGLLASGTKAATIVRARELIAAAAPAQTAHQPQPPDSAAATDQPTYPCPCCGGRMNIIETFKRGATPQYRPPPPTRSLVEAVQRRGVRVVVVSTISTQPPMIAQELRRQADEFIDIIALQKTIGRDPAERPARELREGREPRRTPQFLQRQHRHAGRSRGRRVRRRIVWRSSATPIKLTELHA